MRGRGKWRRGYEDGVKVRGEGGRTRLEVRGEGRDRGVGERRAVDLGGF